MEWVGSRWEKGLIENFSSYIVTIVFVFLVKKYYDKCEQIRNDFNSRSNKEIPAVRSSTEVHSNLGNVNPTLNLEEQVNIKSPPPPMKSPGRKSKLTPREKEEGMCLQDGCFNMAVPENSRGTKYCSNECVVNHSK